MQIQWQGAKGYCQLLKEIKLPGIKLIKTWDYSNPETGTSSPNLRWDEIFKISFSIFFNFFLSWDLCKLIPFYSQNPNDRASSSPKLKGRPPQQNQQSQSAQFNVNSSGAIGVGGDSSNRNVQNKPMFNRNINPSMSNAPPTHKNITTTGTFKVITKEFHKFSLRNFISMFIVSFLVDC